MTIAEGNIDMSMNLCRYLFSTSVNSVAAPLMLSKQQSLLQAQIGSVSVALEVCHERHVEFVWNLNTNPQPR